MSTRRQHRTGPQTHVYYILAYTHKHKQIAVAVIELQKHTQIFANICRFVSTSVALNNVGNVSVFWFVFCVVYFCVCSLVTRCNPDAGVYHFASGCGRTFRV